MRICRERAIFSRLQSLGLEEDLHTCLSEDRLDAVGERAPDGWFYAGTQRPLMPLTL